MPNKSERFNLLQKKFTNIEMIDDFIALIED